MSKKIEVLAREVRLTGVNDQDYICLTDIARYKNADASDDLIRNWLRNRNTIEFLSIWEQINNPGFNPVEFDGIKKLAGLNSFTLTPKQWIERVGFSARSLWRMIQFCCEFRCRSILKPLVREMNWAWNIVIDNRITYSLSPGNPGERAGVRGTRSLAVRPLTPNPSPRVQGEGRKSFKRKSEQCVAPSLWHDLKPVEGGLLA